MCTKLCLYVTIATSTAEAVYRPNKLVLYVQGYNEVINTNVLVCFGCKLEAHFEIAESALLLQPVV